MKKCTLCKRDLPEDEYYESDKCRCKECHRKIKREWYQKTRKKPDGIIVRNGRYVNHQGSKTTIYWTGNMISDLKRYFPTTKNEELAELIGVSPRTMIRKARELGLVKDADWQANMSKHNGFYGYYGSKRISGDMLRSKVQP